MKWKTHIYGGKKVCTYKNVEKYLKVIGNTAKGKTGFLRMENAVIDMHIN